MSIPLIVILVIVVVLVVAIIGLYNNLVSCATWWTTPGRRSTCSCSAAWT